MSANLLWIAAWVVLVTVISFTAFLRLNLRHLKRVAGRSIFDPEGRRKSGIRLDRERATLSLTAFHTAWVGLLGLMLTAFRFSAGRSPLEAVLEAFLGLGVTLALFDQLIPWLWMARHNDPEAAVRRWGAAIIVFYWLAYPLTLPIYVFSSLRSLLEPEEKEPNAIPQQEAIQDFIEAGQEEGLIEESEGEMIQSVVEFGDKRVREVMIPRHEINTLESRASLRDLRRMFRKNKHRRIVVYEGELDRVQGIVNVGDLLRMTPEEESQAELSSLITPVRFVPETKKVSELLKELQQETLQIALVIDEYGAVAGLVTIEDLVEEIVGEIRDEVEPHEDDIVKESENSFLVAGHAEVSHLADLFDAAVEGRDYNTVSGLIISKLGRVPPAGERVEKGGLNFEVLESNTRTVLRVRVIGPGSSLKPSPDSHVP